MTHDNIHSVPARADGRELTSSPRASTRPNPAASRSVAIAIATAIIASLMGAACTSGLSNGDWTSLGTARCTPGTWVRAGCSARCGVGSCTGDPVLRVCDGADDLAACARGAALRENDDACGSLCPAVEVTCPASGWLAFLGRAYGRTGPYECTVATREMGGPDGGVSDAGAPDGSGTADGGPSDGGSGDGAVALDARDDGAAACVTPFTLCRGVCTDIRTDNANCGQCGRQCHNPGTCQAGVCVAGCDPSALCGGVCVTLATDPANCGACGRTCPPGGSCSLGQCRCAPGSSAYVVCGSVCVNPQVDEANCGACGNTCASGQLCLSGRCVTCGCGGRTCGNDACGRSCGTCAAGTTCNTSGTCESICRASRSACVPGAAPCCDPAESCRNVCPSTYVCCRAPGAACTSGTQCCGRSCVGGRCGDYACA